MTKELIQQLMARIAQLEQEREQWIKDAHAQYQHRLGQFDGAIAELQIMVDGLESDVGENEKDVGDLE